MLKKVFTQKKSFLNRNKLSIITFSDLTELKGISDCLAIPKICNYPLLDAIIIIGNDVLILQITIKKIKHEASLSEVDTIKNIFEKKNFLYLYVVPQENLEDFRVLEHLKLPQAKTSLEEFEGNELSSYNIYCSSNERFIEEAIHKKARLES